MKISKEEFLQERVAEPSTIPDISRSKLEMGYLFLREMIVTYSKF